MSKINPVSKIPVAVGLKSTMDEENIRSRFNNNKNRLLYISVLSVLIAVVISVVAKVLMELITLITNFSFYGRLSFEPIGLIENQIGLFIILIPAIGDCLLV